MKKIRERVALMALGIVFLLLAVGLSGCTEQQISDQSSDEKIISPIALASANPTSGNAPLNVNFTGFGEDNNGYIVSYHWDFDDGNTSDEQNTNHTFHVPGNYNVTFTVTDNESNTGEDYILITVYGGNGDEDSTDDVITTEFFEGWESASLGVYNVKKTGIRYDKYNERDMYTYEFDKINGDAGIWSVSDNYYSYFNMFPEEHDNPAESSPNIAEIISSSGNKYLSMKVPPAIDHVGGVPIMWVSFYEKIEIPLTEKTTISFEGNYQAFEDSYDTDVNEGSYRITLELTVGDESIYYSLHDDSFNQWGHSKYDAIIVNSGLTTRNVYNDYTTVFEHEYKGNEKISGVSLVIHYPGYATYDNIHIHN